MPSTLYHTWQNVVAQTPEATALTDSATGEVLSFAELDDAASALEPERFPRGNDVKFILHLIAAWREGLPICPLEEKGEPVDISGIPTGVAHIKVTSGSTGTPRLILFTADQLAADAGNIVQTMGLDHRRPNIGIISMAHSYGFSNLALPLLLHGIPLILASDPLPGSFTHALTFLPETGGTVPAVPAMWRAWLNAGCLDAERIKIAISAGAPLTLDLERAVYDVAGIKVHNFYGSSECGGIAYDRTTTPRIETATVGTPMDGVTTTLGDDGCLTVHGDAVGSQYWPDADPGTLDGKRFVTQDLASIVADGSLQLHGRAGDLINIAGRKVDPASIEEELLKHHSVDHCIVFGIPSPDPERVQEIVAVTSGGDATELGAHLARAFPAWKKVRHWWLNPEVAPNARGKLSRKEWREKWEQHHAR